MYAKLSEESSDLPAPARLPPPAGSAGVKSSKTQSEKIAGYIKGIGTKVNPEMAGCLTQAEPVIRAVIKFFLVVWPLYRQAWIQGYDIYKKLPHNAVIMIFGACLCFFGGTYVASIAAIEAFRQLGGQKVYE